MLSNQADTIIIDANAMRTSKFTVRTEDSGELCTHFFPPLFLSDMQFTFRAAGIPDSI
jgi:hypothetical protein